MRSQFFAWVSRFGLALLLVLPVAPPVFAQAEILGNMLGIVINQARQRELQEQQQQQQQQQQAQPQVRQDAAQLSRGQTRQVQERLNALGYSVGRPDGVAGAATRNAIADWQRDQGLPVTGALAPADLDLLFASAATPAPAFPAAPGGSADESIGLLYDTDLPYNDYRSGMDDGSLRNIDLETCHAVCSADGQCRAFTFNSKARVCFLKHAATQPVRFNGAISGIKGGGGQSMPAPVEQARLLTQPEVAELQRVLNAGGYDAGPEDGRPGGRTRRAIADFRRDNPGVASDRMDIELLLAVTGTGDFGAAAPQPAFDAAAYKPARDIERQLALVALARNPDAIASDEDALKWLSNDVRRDGRADASQISAAYAAANSVRKPAVLDDYRKAVLAEAREFAGDDGSKAELRIRIDARSRVGAFEPGIGLQIAAPSQDLYSKRVLDLRTQVIWVGFVGIANSLPENLALPFDDAAAASAFLDRLKARTHEQDVTLSAFITLSQFGTDANVTGNSAASRDDIPMTVTIDRLSVNSVRDHSDAAAKPGGEELALLVGPTAGQASGERPDVLVMARRLGIPVNDGHIELPGDDNWNYRYNDAGSAPWQLFNLVALGQNADDFVGQVQNDTIMSLMSPSQRIRVYGTGNTNNLGNEFERRRATKVFDDEILPEIAARAPAFPIPAVALRWVRTRDFDFDKQAFPLVYNQPKGVVSLPQNLGQLYSSQSYVALPEQLPMDEAAAEALVNAPVYNGDAPYFVLATFGNLVPAADGTTGVRLEATRMALYADRGLTQKLLELDPAEHITDGVAAASLAEGNSAADWVNRFGLQVYDGRLLFVPDEFPGRGNYGGIAAAFALGARPERLEERRWTMSMAHALKVDVQPYISPAGLLRLREGNFAPNYEYWAGADEFQLEDSRRRFLADNRAAIEQMLPAYPFEFAVLRRVALNEYDPSRGGFPVGIRFEELVPYVGAVESSLGLATAERDEAVILSMPEAEARTFREQLRGLTGERLDASVFPGAEISVPRDALATITTYRATGVTSEGGLRVQAVPLTRQLYALSNLTAPLAELPFPEPDRAPAAPQASPEEVAVLAGSAEAPQSRFDLLGVTLGMDIEEARRILTERLAGKSPIPLQQMGGGGSMSSCDVVTARLNRDLGAADAARHEEIRALYADDLNEAGCVAKEDVILEPAFGFDVPQPKDEVDRIVVYRAPQSGNVVGAIVRQTPNDLIDAMTAGLIEKYGSDFVERQHAGHERFWVEHPSMAGYFSDRHNNACESRWPELQRIPSRYFEMNCGAFVRQQFNQVMLIDTRYINLQWLKVSARLQAAAEARPKPKVEF